MRGSGVALFEYRAGWISVRFDCVLAGGMLMAGGLIILIPVRDIIQDSAVALK